MTATELVLNRMVRPGDNIRRSGEDIEPVIVSSRQASDWTLVTSRFSPPRGEPASRVRRRPRVGIVSTGNELVQPGTAARRGSDLRLRTARWSWRSRSRQASKSSTAAGCAMIPSPWPRPCGELSATCDLVVTTGGASVGEEDHSATAVARPAGFSRR